MSDGRPKRRDTLIQHLGEENPVMGAVVPPIFQNSLFVFDDWDEFAASFTQREGTKHNYSRIRNPSLDVPEAKFAALEQAEAGKLFSSGMAAISAAIMNSVSTGDHVVCVDTVYGPSRQFLAQYLPRFGITTTFVDGRDPQEWLNACQPNTKLFYLESPSSILFRLQDFAAVTAIARERGITTVADNSYASPIYQNPIAHGVDIVVHSASKYLGGHSDVVAGALATNRERMNHLIDDEVALFGGTLAPFPAWLILRAMRTMPLRLAAHQQTGNTIADWLREQPQVREVFHVGLADHPQAELRDRQMTGTTSLLSFRPYAQSEAQFRDFVKRLEIFQMGVSWGGHESLAIPIFTQPGDWPEPQWVVRLYCGLEDPEDLMEDLANALKALDA